MKTSNSITRFSDRLSQRSGRRGFLKQAARITSAVAVAGGGISKAYRDVVAGGPCTPGAPGCILAFPNNRCPYFCPPESDPWLWDCCVGGCLIYCGECYGPDCSISWTQCEGCEGGSCGGCRQGAITPESLDGFLQA